jgi:hypothetical protein
VQTLLLSPPFVGAGESSPGIDGVAPYAGDILDGGGACVPLPADPTVGASARREADVAATAANVTNKPRCIFIPASVGNSRMKLHRLRVGLKSSGMSARGPSLPCVM